MSMSRMKHLYYQCRNGEREPDEYRNCPVRGQRYPYWKLLDNVTCQTTHGTKCGHYLHAVRKKKEKKQKWLHKRPPKCAYTCANYINCLDVFFEDYTGNCYVAAKPKTDRSVNYLLFTNSLI
jgi:hypothetical protein